MTKSGRTKGRKPKSGRTKGRRLRAGALRAGELGAEDEGREEYTFKNNPLHLRLLQMSKCVSKNTLNSDSKNQVNVKLLNKS